jgi:wobble nucleotide-excising tRNase
MIKNITIDKVGSFKKAATITLDKKVNIFYGLNGSGKSTIGRALRDPSNAKFDQCRISVDSDSKILVFNDDFVRENFYESDTIKGVFSLSKENKKAELGIAEERDQLQTLLNRISKLNDEAIKISVEKERDESKSLDKIFDIKRKYSGGDRVLEFCLEGAMSKDRLYAKLCENPRPLSPLDFSIEDLQREARLIQESDSNPLPPISELDSSLPEIENDTIFQSSIVGSTNSSFSEFINKIGSSDWVKEGLHITEAHNLDSCPFCQEETLTPELLSKLTNYFDATYSTQIEKLSNVGQRYKALASSLPTLEKITTKIHSDTEIPILYERLVSEIGRNIQSIDRKMAQPSLQIALTKTSGIVKEINEKINASNIEISKYNTLISNRKSALNDIKAKFWSLMRDTHHHLIDSHKETSEKHAIKLDDNKSTIAQLESKVVATRKKISALQKETVNIDESVDRINQELANIGISDFELRKHKDHLYKLHREDSPDCEFKNLSEGEKMIIGLLYFCELCEGKESETEVDRKVVAVLDDPISSMSHIFVFNVGRLIKHRFIDNKKISQVLVLTHSLYFFYEMTDPNKDRRHEYQSLFRIVKTAESSNIVTMKYEEIRNDYQAYWQLINDRSLPPVLIANAMRNTVEYFFGFVEKSDFANVFQKPALKTNRFQAFNRYMNRESHSFGQNVFDLKEFDYDIFREALKLLFENCGYGEHYKKMAA